MDDDHHRIGYITKIKNKNEKNKNKNQNQQ
jgi:hypothetical protein